MDHWTLIWVAVTAVSTVLLVGVAAYQAWWLRANVRVMRDMAIATRARIQVFVKDPNIKERIIPEIIFEEVKMAAGTAFQLSFYFQNFGGTVATDVQYQCRYGIVKPLWHKYPLIKNSRWFNGVLYGDGIAQLVQNGHFEWSIEASLYGDDRIKAIKVPMEYPRIGTKPLTFDGVCIAIILGIIGGTDFATM